VADPPWPCKPGKQDLSADDRITGFAVDIPGLPRASKNIRSVEFDTAELGPRRRVFGPGAAHWGSAKFTSAVTPGSSKELQTWFQEAAKGRNVRKNITVTLFKSNKSPGRSYDLFDCFPTAYSAVNFDTSSTVQTETITIRVPRIEFKT
jgi:phage tail-like protein